MDNIQTFTPPDDPFTQPVTLLFPDGSPFNVTMDQMSWYHFYGVRWGIGVGSSIGATGIMILALLLLTRPEKRTSPIFILNGIALAVNLARTVLYAVYMSGPFMNPYAVLTNDWDQITALDKSNSVADPVLTLILLIIIEMSLLLQVKVVLGTITRIHRTAIVMVCAIVGLVALGFQAAFTVVNSQYIVALKPGSTKEFQDLAQQTNITTIVSLCFFTTIFVGKLGFAILQRRNLGMTKFGPMQVIFIMGLQTLFVPTLVALLQYSTDIPAMYAQFLTLVTLSLPLSSLWAAASIDGLAHLPNKKPILAGTYSTSSSPGKSAFSEKTVDSIGCREPPLSPMSDTIPEASDLELGHTRSAVGKSWSE